MTEPFAWSQGNGASDDHSWLFDDIPSLGNGAITAMGLDLNQPRQQHSLMQSQFPPPQQVPTGMQQLLSQLPQQMQPFPLAFPMQQQQQQSLISQAHAMLIVVEWGMILSIVVRE